MLIRLLLIIILIVISLFCWLSFLNPADVDFHFFGGKVIPTDLSKNSHSALQKDLDWVRQLGAKVLFLHVAETPYIPAFSLIDPKDYEAKMIEIAQKHFEEFLKKLSLHDISYETQQCEGVPATEIVRQAQKIKADLIMLSTHGQTGLGYRLLGTVATKVLRHAPCSVLLTRPGTLDFSWLKKEILSA